MLTKDELGLAIDLLNNATFPPIPLCVKNSKLLENLISRLTEEKVELEKIEKDVQEKTENKVEEKTE